MARVVYRIVFAFTVLFTIKVAKAQWQTTCQPNDVNSIVPNGSKLLVNDGGSSIWESPDSGKTWTSIFNSTQDGDALISALFVNSGTIFVGTQGSGVFRSTDNGKDWSAADTGMSSSASSVTIFYALGDTVFAATSDLGVFRTVNGGLNWVEADSGLPSVAVNQVSGITSIGSALFAASTNGYPNIGVFESTDYGKYWSSVLSLAGHAANPGCMATSSGNLLLAVESTSNFRYYLSVSTNGGKTWNPDTTGATSFTPGIAINAFASSGSDVLAGTTMSGIFRSSDGGIDWTQTNTGLLGYNTSSVNSIAFQGTNVFAECGGGNLFLSADNGQSWKLMTNGVPGDTASNGQASDTLSQNVTIDFENSFDSFAEIGSKIFAGISGDGVYVSSDAGISWSPANNGLPYPADGDAITAIGDSILVAGVGGSFVPGTVYRSTNEGATWVNVNNGISINTGVNQLASIGSNVVAAASSGGYLSTDGGATWNVLGGTNSFPSLTIQTAFAQHSTFFAGGSGTGILRSVDDGTHWTIADSGIANNVNVSSVGGDGTDVFAVTSKGLYESKDNGISWAISDSGLPVGTTISTGLLSGQHGAIALVTTPGSFSFNLGNVFLSTNDGTSWSAANEGLIPTSISSVFIDSGKVYIGDGNSGSGPWGVWYWQLPTITSPTGVHQPNGVPLAYSLSQNYPNPFNPTTVINYQLPAASSVTLKVYDILGRVVATLVNTRQNAGEYSLTFDGSRLASGVYFYRLAAGNYISTKKLVLVK